MRGPAVRHVYTQPHQVRLAQKSIPTGLVYKQNEEVLDAVGVAPLQKMLEARDWTGLEGKKVCAFVCRHQ